MDETKIPFDDFANFRSAEQTGHKEALPLKERLPEANKVHFGTFSSTFELDDHSVAKLNRLGAGDSDVFLTYKTGDPEQDMESVVANLTNLSEEKKFVYKIMCEFMPTYTPKLKFMAIVDSPRKELEKRHRLLYADEISRVPDSEITLMEVWENIGISESLERLSYKALAHLRLEPGYLEQMTDFAQRATTMFFKTHMMLDVCDRNGIRVIDKTNTSVALSTLDDTVDLLEDVIDSTTVYPRNVAFSNGVLKYYDMYPVNYYDSFLSTEEVANIATFVSNADGDGLAAYVTNAEDYFDDFEDDDIAALSTAVRQQDVVSVLNTLDGVLRKDVSFDYAATFTSKLANVIKIEGADLAEAIKAVLKIERTRRVEDRLYVAQYLLLLQCMGAEMPIKDLK